MTGISKEELKNIALRLGETGLSAGEAAYALGVEEKTVEMWLTEAGMDPEGKKGMSKRRQAEGIADAKARGVRFGRPRVKVPEDFGEIVSAWEQKEFTLEQAVGQCGMSESTFYRRLREYRKGQKKRVSDSRQFRSPVS